MTEIKTACQDHQAGQSAVKCLSQGHNKMVQVVFEPRPCRSRSGALTTRPRCRYQHFKTVANSSFTDAFC